MSPKKTPKPVNNFFAIPDTGDIHKIVLTQDVTQSIRNVFVESGAQLENNELDQVQFDSNYRIEEGEVLFVTMDLDARVIEDQTNSVGIPILNFPDENIKTLFWIEGKVFYFQNFDSPNLLVNRNIIVYSANTFTALK